MEKQQYKLYTSFLAKSNDEIDEIIIIFLKCSTKPEGIALTTSRKSVVNFDDNSTLLNFFVLQGVDP